jgi:anaphase-promoting complex subunit 5
MFETRHHLPYASRMLKILGTLVSMPMIDTNLAFQLALLKIEYLQCLGSFKEAYEAMDSLADQLEEEEADLYQRIHVMVMKALLFARIGEPLKGFSLAMTAANAAWQTKLLPTLWEAWGAVANIMGSLGEFKAQHRILEAVIPQALACRDNALSAQLYVWQADACMGLAGDTTTATARLKWMMVADRYLARAKRCEFELPFFSVHITCTPSITDTAVPQSTNRSIISGVSSK